MNIQNLIKQNTTYLLTLKINLNDKEVSYFVNITYKPKDIEEELIDNTDIPFYALVLDKRIYDAKLLTGNIKHYPKKDFIMTAEEFISKYF